MKIIKGPVKLDINAFRQGIKEDADISEAGMILIHNGFVRANDLEGNRVVKIDVRADAEKLAEILRKTAAMKGIIAVDAWIVEGTLEVGDDIMLLGVAGDTRKNVITALSSALDAVKAGVTDKYQHLA